MYHGCICTPFTTDTSDRDASGVCCKIDFHYLITSNQDLSWSDGSKQHVWSWMICMDEVVTICTTWNCGHEGCWANVAWRSQYARRANSWSHTLRFPWVFVTMKFHLESDCIVYNTCIPCTKPMQISEVIYKAPLNQIMTTLKVQRWWSCWQMMTWKSNPWGWNDEEKWPWQWGDHSDFYVWCGMAHQIVHEKTGKGCDS